METLRSHVQFLCQGSRTPHSPHYYETQNYLMRQIESFGLKPQFHDFYDLAVGNCKNIFAEKGPSLGPRILIGAHYESIPSSGPAADDNASAVAVALEVLRTAPNHIPITVVFFDIEENFGIGALRGSKAFASWYAEPLRGVIIMDLVGGSLTPVFEQSLFQFGNFLPHDSQANLDIFYFPTIFLEPIGPAHARSDYKYFRSRGVPWTFFSTGTPWYYHTPHDTIENLNFEKMSGLVQLILNNLSYSLTERSEANWSQWMQFLSWLEVVPELRDTTISQWKTKTPNRWTILCLYKTILPILRKKGRALWDESKIK